MDMDVIEAQWILGILPREQLPDIAADALEKGMDNISLRILAGLITAELDEAANLFEEALKSLGRGKLKKSDAVRFYARFISRQILSKEVEPYVGASKIWEASLRGPGANFHDVDTFIYAASEYENRPEDREFFNKEILKEAQRFVTQPA